MSATLRQNHCSALFSIVQHCSLLFKFERRHPSAQVHGAKVLHFFDISKSKYKKI